jgi:phospholipase D1/2
VLAVRVFPVAPFTIVNLVAGASHIRFRDFLIGTALGMAPGIGTVSIFSDQLVAVFREPSLATLSILAAVILAIAGGAIALQSWLRRRTGNNGNGLSARVAGDS